MAEEQKVGVITHYFGKVGVGIVKLTDGELKIGDTIHVKGHSTDFTQAVESMQLEHAPITEGKKGMDIGIKIAEHTREHDVVYKLVG